MNASNVIFDTLMKILAFLIFFLILLSCASNNYGNPYQKYTPGVYAVNDILIVDETENTNFHWMEYMFWVKRTFGIESLEYLAVLAETAVWNEDSCLIKYVDFYLRHPAYRDYPVVGISQKQARDFAQWRSDRVYEYNSIRAGMIDQDTSQNAAYHFTIERYLRGSYTPQFPEKPNSLPEELIGYIPVHRLPDTSERTLYLTTQIAQSFFTIKSIDDSRRNGWKKTH